jgi:alpha-amylase/alpha-mannosidase (GH57 family)
LQPLNFNYSPMLASNNFQETTITLDGKQYRMEYDLAAAIENSVRCFGNIYLNEDKPMEFTFFTLNNKIAGYTPMNGKKEFIANIVETTTGKNLPFE